MSTAPAEASAPRLKNLGLAGGALWPALTAVFLAIALGIGLWGPLPDISWLCLVADRVLHGQQLYTQIIELNPPMSVLLYMPPVILADWSGLDPVAATAGLCLLAITVSVMLSGMILRPLLGDDRIKAWKFVAAAALVLCAMPGAAFAQREHIAVIALLPFLAITMLRAEGRAPSWPPAIVAGLGLGIAISIKPYFAAAGILPAFWAMWRRRAFRPYAQLELWAAGAVVAGYALVVAFWFPAFVTDLMPTVLKTYVPVRSPFWLLLVLPGIPVALGAAILARLMKLESRWLAVPMLAALGGAAAFLIQGKGWPYHAYPMLAFAILGLLAAAIMAPPARAPRWGWLEPCMLSLPLAAAAWLWTGMAPGPLLGAVAAVAPPSPTLIGVSGVGLTLVRPLHARWVGSECIEWISDGVLRLRQAGRLTPAQGARFDGLVRAERARLGRDIRQGRPDVILFARGEYDWRTWALQDVNVAEALGHYRLATSISGVEVWTRTGR